MNTQIGQTIGNCRLERVLGHGFLGDTYLARHLRENRQVALKIIHHQFTDDSGFRQRFLKLVGEAAPVQHANILPIMDFGEAAGFYYIMMELLQDGSLRALLQKPKSDLPLPRAVALLRQAADGLTAAHARGLLHRDVKPENLLLQRRPGSASFGGAIVRLADFGFTRLAESGATIGGNVALGSLPYLSPEHCKGFGLDARSDIYSLGVVLYEAVTGGPPFQVTNLADALRKHLTSDPPPPHTLVSNLPGGLEEIILRCLHKDAAARYQSAGEVSAALGALGLKGEIEVVVGGGEGATTPARPSERPGGIQVRFQPEGSPPPAQPQPPAPPPAADSEKRWQVRLGASGPPAPPPPPTPPAGGTSEAAQETIVAPASPDPRAGKGGGWQLNLGQDAPGGPASRSEDQTIIARPSGLENMARPSPKPAGRSRSPTSKLVTVIVDQPSLTLTPGQPGLLRVTVVNTSRRVEHFRIGIERLGGPGAVVEPWVELPRDRIQLIPEGRATVPLKILVPKAPGNAAGLYDVQVSATGEVSGEVGTVAVSWTVLPYFDTFLTVTPGRIRGWRRATFSVGLKNQGNAPVRCTLSAHDDERALRYEFSQSEVSLDHGVGATVDLRTRARLRLLGSAEDRTCHVRAERAGSDSGGVGAPEFKNANAQFVHRAVIPTWVLPVVPLILGLVIFWPKTQLHVDVVPDQEIALTVGNRTMVNGFVKNQKQEAVAGQPIIWAIQDTTVAAFASTAGDTVFVVGRKVGSTSLTAKTKRTTPKSVRVSVTVPLVESVALVPAALSLAIGETRRLTAIVKDASGKPVKRDINWVSSDMSVATIGNGAVTAKAAGAAVVTAMVEGKTANAEINVRPDTVGRASGGGEDCESYEPSLLDLKKVKIKNGKEYYAVMHQQQTLLRLDQKSEAEAAQGLARRHKQHCYFGRRNQLSDSTSYYIEYWKGNSDLRAAIKKEDCLPYARETLHIENHEQTGQGWGVMSGTTQVVKAASEADAKKVLELAGQYSALCYIGRNNKRENHRLFMVQYWK